MMDPNAHAPAAARSSERPVARRARDWWDSQRLLGDKGEIKIRHRGEIYSLRITRMGKLILTK